jgi:hypothetical protein
VNDVGRWWLMLAVMFSCGNLCCAACCLLNWTLSLAVVDGVVFSFFVSV